MARDDDGDRLVVSVFDRLLDSDPTSLQERRQTRGQALQVLAANGAVGDICLHYYNAAGEPVLSREDDPVIGMELQQVRACEHVIGLAGGLDKSNAIRGALTGGYLDVLIIDYPTACTLI